MVIQKFLRGERVLSIDQDKKSSRVSRIQLARETCVATCRGSDALFPESNSGPRNAAGNPAVAVLVSVIGKGLLARISQSGDFPPTYCSFGPTPEVAPFGPFLPGRGLNPPDPAGLVPRPPRACVHANFKGRLNPRRCPGESCGRCTPPRDRPVLSN